MPPLPDAAVEYPIDGLWILLLLYWVAFAWNNKRTVRRQTSMGRWLYILVAPLGVLILRQFPITRTPFFATTAVTQIIGLMLCTGGVAFAIWARRTLGRNWSGLVTVKQDHQLIQSGPYRLVRHPIYTGITCAFLGTVVAEMPTIRGAIYLLLMIVAFTLKLHVEEGVMRQEFPEAYPAYRERVRTAFLPLLY